MKLLKVLILEDDKFDLELIKNEVSSKLNFKFDFLWVQTKDEYVNALEQYKPDIILSDYNLFQFSGFKALEISQDKIDLIPFIIVTGALKEEVAAESIKKGAWDYVVKERIHRLPGAIENALKLKNEKLKSIKTQNELDIFRERAGLRLKIMKSAMERAPAAIFITDVEGTINYVNPKFIELTGFQLVDVIGSNPRVLKSGEHDSSYYKFLWDTVLSGKEYEGEVINKKKNGDCYHAQVSVSPIKDKKGEIEHFVAIQRDVTDEKKYREELKASNNYYRTIFGNTPTASCIYNPERLILQINNEFENLSEYSKQEVEGKMDWTQVVDTQDLIRTIKFSKNDFSLPENKLINHEFILVTKNKTRKNILVNVANIPGTDYHLASLQDITNRKKSEDELIKAKLKAEESNRLKSAFMQNISHELRTPLNAIIGFGGLIDHSMDLDEIVELSDIIEESGYELLAIIEEIFEISFLQSRQIHILHEEFDLNEVFLKLNTTVKYEVKRKSKNHLNIEFVPATNDINFIIKSDRIRISRLLINLLNNAIEFTETGHVKYGYYVEENDVRLYVSDTGIGIPNNMAEDIFKPFIKVESHANKVHGGIGIGLTICKEIASLMNGKLWFETIEGEGSTFYFSLPLGE